MDKKAVLELKKRFRKDDATFSRVCGCYVDSNKQIVSRLNSQFLTLDDEEYYKYLEIAKKSLSGKIGNNLFNIDFPLDEEKTGGRQQMLMALRDSDLKNEDLLTSFYEHIIDTYDCAGHYLILLYLDNYDVIAKTEDKAKLDESEEVYKYLICSICPVNLSKAALGYNESANQIKSRERDWVVGAPESAFLFPAFNDRSTDIHSALFYSKKSRDVHNEFVKDGLGCKSVMSSDEKRDSIQTTIANTIDDGSDIESTIVSIYMDLQKQADDNECELSSFRLSSDMIEESLKNNGLSDNTIKAVKNTLNEVCPDGEIWGSDVVDEKYMQKNKLLLDYKALAEENARLNEKLNKTYTVDNLKDKYASYSGPDSIDGFIESLK